VREDIIIIGAGVSGLSSGIRLLEAGLPVAIYARELPPRTTSDVAIAVWLPFAVAAEHLADWAKRTLAELTRLAADPRAGISSLPFVELLPSPEPEPWWAPLVGGFRHLRPEELPAPYGAGYAYQAPLVETPRYMPYLVARFLERGGRIEQREVESLAALAARHPLIINCAGLGARELCQDAGLYPARGQILRVEDPGVGRGLFDDKGPAGLCYIVPRADGCVLGGTYEEHRWELTEDPETAREIVEKCARLVPALRGARVLGGAVGLRPARASVRLEVEALGEARIIHNYGHGGAGFTLSWGCADEVLRLALLL
jgi:D-amino-acid oxidase